VGITHHRTGLPLGTPVLEVPVASSHVQPLDHAGFRIIGGLPVGELIGSVVANSLLVLGVTAVIAPIVIDGLIFFTTAAFLIFLVILFASMMSRGRFTWREGIVLVLFYVLFLVIELNINQFFLT